MEFYLDSADLEEIVDIKKTGLLSGVTTNPSLIKKSAPKRDDLMVKNDTHLSKISTIEGELIKEYILMILNAVEGHVSLEVEGGTAESMFHEGKKLYDTFTKVYENKSNVVIKIPISYKGSFEGLKAINELSRSGIETNATLIFTPRQALAAAKAGAAYISPFVGRIDDSIRKQLHMRLFNKEDYLDGKIVKMMVEEVQKAYAYNIKHQEGGRDLGYHINRLRDRKGIFFGNDIYCGTDLVRNIKDVFKEYNIKTKMISASIRNAGQVKEVMAYGSDIATLPYKVMKGLFNDDLTDSGYEKFNEEYIPLLRKK